MPMNPAAPPPPPIKKATQVIAAAAHRYRRALPVTGVAVFFFLSLLAVGVPVMTAAVVGAALLSGAYIYSSTGTR